MSKYILDLIWTTILYCFPNINHMIKNCQQSLEHDQKQGLESNGNNYQSSSKNNVYSKLKSK